MTKEKWFRVIYGFGVVDQVSIQKDELQKALYAQKFGEVVQLAGKQINGKYIRVIEPHFHKYTGWYESYEPKDGEDLAQIKRDCPPDLEEIIRQEREKVDYLISTGKKHLIGKNIEIPELEKPKQNQVSEISKQLADKFKIN